MKEERQNCFLCGEEISHNNTFTKEGWKEVEISKMCEECFDKNTLGCETMDNAQKFIKRHKILKRISKECDGVILGGGIFRNFVDPKDKIEDIDLFFKCGRVG